ncbi:hypothetical protein C9391_22165, partial [Xanthomonas vasicola pv. vasculorum]
AQHSDTALLHVGASYAGDQQHAEEAAQLGEHADADAHAFSNQQVDSGEHASADTQHAGEHSQSEQVQSEQHAD